MKNAILYILASGLVHAAAWYGVLPFVADSLDSEVEEELHKPTVQSAVEPSPVVLVATVEEEAVEAEFEEPEPDEPEPEPEIAEPEPEPEPEVEADSEPEIVEPEPEPEIAEPEPEEEPKPESAPVQEPEEEEDNRLAAASAGGSDAEPAGTTSDSQPPRPAGTGSGAGGGTSTGYGAGDQAKGTPTTQQSRSSKVDRSKMLRAYQLKLARIFQAKKKYPRRARRQGLEGEVVVEVVVDGSGAIVSSRVVKSSGYDGLDEAALEAVTSIGKLPPPPSELDWNQRKLRIPYKYRLS